MLRVGAPRCPCAFAPPRSVPLPFVLKYLMGSLISRISNVWAGKFLEDTRKVSHYNLHHNITLQLTYRLDGGGGDVVLPQDLPAPPGLEPGPPDLLMGGQGMVAPPMPVGTGLSPILYAELSQMVDKKVFGPEKVRPWREVAAADPSARKVDAILPTAIKNEGNPALSKYESRLVANGANLRGARG